MSTKYLYGASVQGIQGFIFETNKLREIAGASELVDNIFSLKSETGKALSEFEKYCNTFNHKVVGDAIIMSAAGNIKYIVDEDIAKKIVKGFPKYIANYAPGLTISQAVVELSHNIKNDIDALERKLKIQRNKVAMPVDIGFMGLKRARKTGKVGVEQKKDKKGKLEVFDRGTLAKTDKKLNTLMLFEKFTGLETANVPLDIEKITGKAENSWIAIIHADGNGLGNVLQNMAQGIKESQEYKNGDIETKNNLQKEVFNIFSKKLKEATENAAKITFEKIVPKLKDENDIYPFRPVILGGDDLTVIIRADLAYDFTKHFLSEFEKQTDTHFEELKKYGVTKLTACAGISYIKDKYPFHYGVHLAESLVKKAKEFSKLKVGKDKNGIVPSSLAFYKVQSSFTDELSEMKKRTHFAEKSNVNFDYGPYLLVNKNGFANVGELDILLENIKKFKTDKSKGISKLRQWISELYKDKSKAKFLLDRIKSVNEKFHKELNLQSPFTEREIRENGEAKKQDFSIYNDLIQLYTFKEMYNEN